MNFLKRVGLFIGSGLLVMVAAAVALRIAFPPQRIRGIVQDRIHQKLHRDVQLQGIHVGFYGLAVDRLQLSNEPAFSAGTFLVAQRVKLAWSLRSIIQSLNWRTGIPQALQGRLSIQQVSTAYYRAQDVVVQWNLTGVDPTWTHLNGWVRLDQGHGLLQNVDQLAASSGKGATLILTPLRLLQQLDKKGLANLGLPDLSHWVLHSVAGEYHFEKGTMKIDRFHVDGEALTLDTAGTVEVATEILKLQTKLHATGGAAGGPLDAVIGIGGTLSHPEFDLSSLKKKAFRATVQTFLNNAPINKDIKDTLQKLFH